MKTWTEWQQEERRLMGKEDENQQKRRTVQQLQEAYEIHFRQGLQFVEKISWQFRKNDQAFLHEQCKNEFSLSHVQRKNTLKSWKKSCNKKKENWKNKSMKSPTKKEKHS
ncbi:DUF3958 family protein [Listeria welshimeri]|uniref:DUF3958 family protein n=1 Tax=Listeria welshimeri TaxID=1643 RepID=UPI00396F6588